MAADSPSDPLETLLRSELTLEAGLQTIREQPSLLTPDLAGRLSRRAHELMDLGDLPGAVKLYRWAVRMAEALELDRGVAWCSLDLGELLENMQEHQSAIESYRKALPWYLSAGDPEELMGIYFRIAECYSKSGLTLQAADVLKEAAGSLAEHGFEGSAKVNLYPRLEQLLISLGEHAEARRVEHELEKAKARLAHVESIRGSFQGAIELWREGKIRTALELLTGAGDVLRRYGDGRDKASYLLNLGALLSDSAEYGKASSTAQEAIQAFSEIGDARGEASARKNHASNLEDCGSYQASLDQYRLALATYERLGDAEATARTHNELGVLYKNLNMLMDALASYSFALPVAREEEASDLHRDVLGNLDTLFTKLSLRLAPDLTAEAHALFEQGRYSAMARLLQRGSSAWKSSAAPPSPSVVDGATASPPREAPTERDGNELMDAGLAHLTSGRVRHAIQEFHGAATTFRAAGCTEHAIDAFYEAGELCEAHGVRHDLLQIAPLLGSCLVDAGRHDEARELLEETLQEATRRGSFSVIWRTRAELARTYAAAGRTAQAAAEYATVLDEIETQARTFKHVRTAGGFLADKAAVYGRYVDLLLGEKNKASAYDVVLRAKSWPFVNLSGHVRSSRGLGTPPPSSPARADSVARALRGLTSAWDERMDEDAERWLRDTEELHLLTELCETTWSLPDKVEPKRVEVKDLRGRLDGDTAIVDFFFTDSGLHIFVVTREMLEHISIGTTQDEMYQVLLRDGCLWAAQRLGDRRAVERARAHLSRWIGDAIAELLRHSHPARLCLCLHGILHTLPVVSAVCEHPALGPGLEGGSETCVTSWRVPHASFSQARGPRPCKPDSRYLGVGITGTELGGAGGEIEEVSRRFAERGRDVLVAEQVNLEEVLDRMAQAQVVHFACHGVLRDDMPELSFLALGPAERLRAVDVQARGRTSAELVVLSACRTALGHVPPSDEIVSLAMSFLYAGAGAVLATLWPVPDAQTREFVSDFFRLWVTEQEPMRSALAIAKQLHRDAPEVGSSFVLLEAPRTGMPH